MPIAKTPASSQDTFLKRPAEFGCSALHLEVVHHLCQAAHGHGPFWKWMVKVVRVKAHNQHGPFAIAEVMKYIRRQPIRFLCSVCNYALHHGIGERSVTLSKVGAWQTERQSILERLPSDRHRHALEELFAIASYAWFIDGRPGEKPETKDRNDLIAGDLPPAPDEVVSCDALMATLGHWWSGAKERDPGHISVPTKPISAAVMSIHKDPDHPSLKPSPQPILSTATSTDDLPIHKDLRGAYHLLFALPDASEAWSELEITRFHALIDSTARSVRERSSATRQRIAIAMAIRDIASLARQLNTNDDVDLLVQARIAIWHADQFGDAGAADAAFAALRQALNQVLVERLATDQMSGLTRSERLRRAHIYDTACTAAQTCILTIDGLATSGAPVPPVAAATVDPSPVREPAPVTSKPPKPVPVDPPRAVASPGPAQPEPPAPIVTAQPPMSPAPASAPCPPAAPAEDRDLAAATTPATEPCDNESEPQAASASTIDPMAMRIWELAARGEYILAGHLARLRARRQPEAPPLPDWLFHGPVVGRYVTGYDADAAEVALVHDICNGYDACWRHDGQPDWNTGCRLLLAASLLRPAILMPQTGANAVLGELRLDGALRSHICGALADPKRPHIPVGVRAIKGAQHAVARQAAIQQVCVRAGTWIATAAHRNLIGPAKVVWDDWTRPDGELRSLMSVIQRDDRSSIAKVRDALGRWSDNHWLRNHIDTTDKRVRYNTNYGIEARAERNLSSRRDDVVNIAGTWIALVDESPQPRDQDQQLREAQGIRHVIQRDQAAVRAQLAELQASPSPCIRAGATALQDAVVDLCRLFDPEIPLEAPLSIQDTLHLDLLRLVDLHLDAEGHLETDAAETLDAAILAFERVATNQAVPDLISAVRARITAGDLRGAERGLISGRIPSEQLVNLRAEFDAAAPIARATLRQDADRLRVEIEDAAALGTIISEAEFQDAIGIVQQILVRLDRPEQEDIRRSHVLLDRIRASLSLAHRTQVDRLRQRLNDVRRDGSPLPPDDPSRQHIEQALSNNQIAAAKEYLDIVEEGEPIAPMLIPAVDDPAPYQHQQLYRYLMAGDSDHQHARSRIETLIAALAAGSTVDPVDRVVFRGRHARTQELLRFWWSGRTDWRPGTPNGEITHLSSILTAFGFVLTQPPHREIDVPYALFAITCYPIQDRRVIPVRTYGSDARGCYHVMCVTEANIQPAAVLSQVRDIRSRHGSITLIVLLFQPWSPAERCELARICCQDPPQPFLVFDDVLVLSALLQTQPLLGELVRSALPFSYVKPYMEVGDQNRGAIPPELFYGRFHERDAIERRFGASLVYGGRQLGKTALLRDVQRESHHPERHQIAIYIELQAHGIGPSKPVDDLWALIAQELRQWNVVPEAGSGVIGAERLFQHIQKYLKDNARSQILILLDEADDFLEADGRRKPTPWAIVQRIKLWMQESSGQLHVVFAGLHAVQQAALSGNNPIVQLGEQICIGPMRGKDMEAARNLIVDPLAAIGYRFASPDLVTRILSQANFYPSLIQLSCATLVDRLMASRAKIQAGPPWIISASDVDAAYRDGRLREAIASRFRMTLRIDNRFQIIALILALQDIDQDRAGVYRVEDIQQLAMAVWKRGFVETQTISAFQHLLREMVDFGVLRQVDSERFAIRNINIVPLLGTRRQIAQLLDDATKAPPKTIYNPTEFRQPIGHASGTTRAPITAYYQEILRGQKLSGVVVMRGGSMADAHMVRSYLIEQKAMIGSAVTSDLHRPQSLPHFQRNLLDNIRGRDTQVGTIFVIDNDRWDATWVRDAWNAICRLTASKGWVRFLFLLHPGQAWKHPDLLQLRKDQLPIPTRDLDFAQLPLGPWSLSMLRDHLIEDRGIAAVGETVIQNTAEFTGSWPWMMHRLPRTSDVAIDMAAMDAASQIETDPRIAQAAIEAFDCPDDVRHLLDALLTEDMPPVAEWPMRLQTALGFSAEASVPMADQLRLWLEAFDYAKAIKPGHLAIDTVLSNAVTGMRRSQPSAVNKAP